MQGCCHVIACLDVERSVGYSDKSLLPSMFRFV